MKRVMLRTVALATSISVLVAACADMTPGQNAAVFGTTTGFIAAGIAQAAGLNGWQSLAIGAAAGALAGMTAYVISKHQCTERQRRIAEERARVYYGRLASSKKATLKKNRVRYIAVDTERSKQASPKAKKSIMIWDTQSEAVVGHNVYDVHSTPPVGATGRFDNYDATYVGAGR
jgi:hypothetical protein